MYTFLTDKGSRGINADRLLVDIESGLFLLADGVSKTKHPLQGSTDAVILTYSHLFNGGFPVGLAYGHDDKAGSWLADAVYKTNKRLIERELASTLDVVSVRGNSAVISHVGDGRVYVKDGAGTRKITKDGSIGDALYNFVGSENTAVYTAYQDLKQGDHLLLGTDGISVLENQEIDGVLASGATLDKKLELLKGLARKKGSNDNLTMIIYQHNNLLKDQVEQRLGKYRADLAFKKGEYEEGISILEKIIRKSPADGHAYYIFALFLSSKKEFAGALEKLETAERLGYRHPNMEQNKKSLKGLAAKRTN